MIGIRNTVFNLAIEKMLALKNVYTKSITQSLVAAKCHAPAETGPWLYRYRDAVP